MIPGVDFPAVTVVFFCHDGEGHYLLNKRSVNCRDEHGRWDFGGGSLQLHETIEELLRRELREEYNLSPLEHEFLGFREMHREHQGQKTHWLALDYKVRVDRTQVKNMEPHKFDDLAWFRVDALPAPLHSQIGVAVESYQNRL